MRGRSRLCRVLADDSGSTTVTAAFLVAAVVALAAAAAFAAGALADQARARAAADLAAVAGAVTALETGDGASGCAAADRVAAANGAGLVSCIRDVEDVEVVADVDGRRAVARAGPVDEFPPVDGRVSAPRRRAGRGHRPSAAQTPSAGRAGMPPAASRTRRRLPPAHLPGSCRTGWGR